MRVGLFYGSQLMHTNIGGVWGWLMMIITEFLYYILLYFMELKVCPVAKPAAEFAALCWRESENLHDLSSCPCTLGCGHLLWFKDLDLPHMGISPVLVVGEYADLKEKCLHWSEHMKLKRCFHTHNLYSLSILVCDVHIHPLLWFLKI